MTFAGNDGTKQLFKPGRPTHSHNGPMRRQTMTAAESRRMHTLHSMGLPSVAERKFAEPGRKVVNHRATHNQGTKAGPVPSYMQNTKASSRRQYSHRR